MKGGGRKEGVRGWEGKGRIKGGEEKMGEMGKREKGKKGKGDVDSMGSEERGWGQGSGKRVVHKATCT